MMRRSDLVIAGLLLPTMVAACAPADRSTAPSRGPRPSSTASKPSTAPAESPSAPAATRVVGSPVLDVTFVSATHGWALTAGAMYETTDGGGHWQRARLPVSSIAHVRFATASVGYAWDADGRLWLTTDDTQSWRSGGLSSVDSLEASGGTVWATAGTPPYPDVWRSDLASTVWTKLGSTPNRGGELLPHGEVTYVLGESGAGPVPPSYDVYVGGRKSGNRTLPCEHPPQLVPQSPMTVSTDGSLFLVCDVEPAGAAARQLAYTSTDRGRTWTATTPPPKAVAGVAEAGKTRFGWDLDLWAYRNGRWRLSLKSPTEPPGVDLGGFTVVGFQDDTHALALTTTGQLYLTINAGRTWQISPLPTSVPAQDCRTDELRVQGGREGGGFGTAHVDLQITNVGTRSCALPSPSRLAVVDATGGQLPLETGGLDLAAGASAVALPAHGRASLVLSWENWCGPRNGALTIQIGFARGAVITGSFDGPPDYSYWPDCTTSSKVSMLQVLGPYTTG